MKNFISSNTGYNKGHKVKDIQSHNDRSHKPDYLLPEEFHLGNKTHNFIGENIVDGFNELKSMRIANSKKNSNIRKNENQIIESVIALSEEQALAYINEGRDLMSGGIQIAKDISEKFGMTPLSVDLHLDEGHMDGDTPKYNIHFHISYYNYDFDNNRSVLRTMTKKDFELMQDISAAAMQKHDFNFVRGISKEITGLKHQKRNDFVIDKQKKEINDLTTKRDNLIASVSQGSEILLDLDNEIDSKNKLIEEQDKLIREAKDERKRVQEDTQLSKEEKKLIYKDITTLQNKHRSMRKLYLKEKQDATKLRQREKQRFLKLIEESKTLKIINEDKLATKLMENDDNYIAMANTIKAKNEVLKLTKEVEYYKKVASKGDALNKQLINANKKIDILEVEKDDLTKEVKSLKQKNHQLIDKVDSLNKELKQDKSIDLDR